MNFQTLRFVIIQLIVMVACVVAKPQRSPYAPGPYNYPQVLPQYTSESGNDVDNRFGSGSTVNPIVPTDAGSLYPVDNLNWINSEWPRDKIPFNVLNSQHIQAHRGQAQLPNSNNQQGNTDVRGSFNRPRPNPVDNSGFRSSFLGQPV